VRGGNEWERSRRPANGLRVPVHIQCDLKEILQNCPDSNLFIRETRLEKATDISLALGPCLNNTLRLLPQA
jgi:hypothetical protein